MLSWTTGKDALQAVAEEPHTCQHLIERWSGTIGHRSCMARAFSG